MASRGRSPRETHCSRCGGGLTHVPGGAPFVVNQPSAEAELRARLEGRSIATMDQGRTTQVADLPDGVARPNMLGARPDVTGVVTNDGVVVRPSDDSVEWVYGTHSPEEWRDVVGEGMANLDGDDAVAAFRLAAKDHTFRLLDRSERGLDIQLKTPAMGFATLGEVIKLRDKMTQGPMPTFNTPYGDLLNKQLEQTYDKYPLIRAMSWGEIYAFKDNPAAFKARVEELGPEVRQHINDTRDRVAASDMNLFGNEFDPMAYPELVKGTAKELQLTPDHPAYQQIMHVSDKAWWADVGPRGALAVGGLALAGAGLLTPGVPDGEAVGGAMFMTAVGFGLTGAELALESSRYSAENSAAHIELGSADTKLLPYEDPDFRAAMFAIGGLAGMAELAAIPKHLRALRLADEFGDEAKAIGAGIDAYNARRADEIAQMDPASAYRDARRVEAETQAMPDGTAVTIGDDLEPKTFIDGKVQLPTDYTEPQLMHEGGHAYQQFEKRFPEEQQLREAAHARVQDGADFKTDFSRAEKNQLHRANALFEEDALSVEIKAHAEMLEYADSPEEAAAIEEVLNQALFHRDQARSRLALLEDPNAPRPADFDIYPKKGIADELAKAADQPQDWETFAKLGYRMDEKTGVITRPVGLTTRSGPEIKYGATLGERMVPGAQLSGADTLTDKLEHSSKQVARVRERLGIGDEGALTMDALVEARSRSQQAKAANKLTKQEAEELTRLSKRPEEALSFSEQEQLRALSTRSKAYSQAAGDMTAATEILGEEAAYRVMMAKNPGNMELIQSGTGANTYDQIWLDKESGKVFFVEAKGGTARNSSARKMPDGFHAQQGSAKYHRDLWGARSDAVTTKLKDLGEQLGRSNGAKAASIQEQIDGINDWYKPILAAIKKGNTEYLMVSQKLPGGGLGKAVEQQFIVGPDVLK